MRCGRAHGVGGVGEPAGCVAIGTLDIGQERCLDLAHGLAGALAFAGGQIRDRGDLACDLIRGRGEGLFHGLARRDQATLGLVDRIGDRLGKAAQAGVDFFGPLGKAGRERSMAPRRFSSVSTVVLDVSARCGRSGREALGFAPQLA